VTTRQTFRILLVKPSKYAPNGDVERFRKGFMPNATLLHLRSMTPSALGGRPVVVDTIDEYTQTDLRYFDPALLTKRTWTASMGPAPCGGTHTPCRPIFSPAYSN